MFRTGALTICLTLVLALLLASGPAMAAPVKTNLFGLNGLFLATKATSIDAGELVVGASMLLIADDDVDGSTLPVSVTYGASSDIEIAAAFEVYKTTDDGVNDESGTGDLYFSAKYAIGEETADYPATAVGLRVKLPLADDPLGTEETDFAIFAAAELDMRGVAGILNVEYLMPGNDDPNVVNYVVGVEIPYSETTDFTLELLDQPITGDMFSAGATFDMGSSLNFGVAVGMGLDEDAARDFAVDGKLTFTF